MHPSSRFLSVAFLAAGFAASCGGSSSTTVVPLSDGGLTPGQTEFTTDEQLNGNGGQNASDSAGGATRGAATPTAGGPTAAPGGNAGTTEAAAPGAPGGRDATVQEADIYRIDADRLFYFNTYRGLIIYDLADPKNPKQLSRLPVYGYPVEMFVVGKTVYALLSDALYLSQVKGKLQFDRRYVSQLVSIDVSDLQNPRIVSTVDIIG
ncbi:MAG TPA: beta-propeller domain-containing protein, partial [Polyangia bacterium]